MKQIVVGLFVLICSIIPMNLAQAQDRVVLGLENLLENHLELISGQRVGLMANHTAVDGNGTPILELLQPHCDVTAVFALEHGFTGNVEAGKKIEDEEADDFIIYSLYGNTRKPTPEMLEYVDVIIYDIQDVGVKFYTYISSLYYAMQAAKENDLTIIVLDRPNPIGADLVEGPINQADFYSFVGITPLPIRYGMTVGELANWFNEEQLRGDTIEADLVVIEMSNYDRDMLYDQTGLPWIPPSPNIPTLETALVYPGTCLFEGTNVTEGRGTEKPFLIIGAPFIDANEWIREIPKSVQSGVELQPIQFIPEPIEGKVSNPKFNGEECQGIEIMVTDDYRVQPIHLALAMLVTLRDLYPNDFETKSFLDLLWGNDQLRTMLNNGSGMKDILELLNENLDDFEKTREDYLIY